jgi:hypothetical protein
VQPQAHGARLLELCLPHHGKKRIEAFSFRYLSRSFNLKLQQIYFVRIFRSRGSILVFAKGGSQARQLKATLKLVAL